MLYRSLGCHNATPSFLHHVQLHVAVVVIAIMFGLPSLAGSALNSSSLCIAHDRVLAISTIGFITLGWILRRWRNLKSF